MCDLAPVQAVIGEASTHVLSQHLHLLPRGLPSITDRLGALLLGFPNYSYHFSCPEVIKSNTMTGPLPYSPVFLLITLN
jgi:hypothetical protein